MKRANSIDFLKGLACIAVVLIHVRFPYPVGGLIKAICRFAVPLFFVVSGYFFAYNGTCTIASTAGKIRRSLILAIEATVGLVILLFVQDLIDPCFSLVDFYVSNASAERAAKFLIINAPPPPPLVHLWFLWALVYCYLFALVWFSDGARLKSSGMIAGVLLVCVLLFHQFPAYLPVSCLIPISGVSMRICDVFVFRALPFFISGVWFRQIEDRIHNWRNYSFALIMLVALGGMSSIMEYRLFGDSQFFIGSFIIVAGSFVWAVTHPCGGWMPMVYVGRRLSLMVYVLHIAVKDFINVGICALHIEHLLLVQWLMPIIVIVISLLVAYVCDTVWNRFKSVRCQDVIK